MKLEHTKQLNKVVGHRSGFIGGSIYDKSELKSFDFGEYDDESAISVAVGDVACSFVPPLLGGIKDDVPSTVELGAD